MGRYDTIAQNALDLDRRWKAREISEEQYYAGLAQLATPRVTPTPANWRRAMFRAAARGRLSIADIASLERNKGGTQE